MTKLDEAGRIYNEHDKAFSHVAAYVVLMPVTGRCVAKVAIKRGASGLRTTAFVHWLGIPMVKGVANGGGYDKDTASVASAARKAIEAHKNDEPVPSTPELDERALFFRTARLDGGKRWDDALRDVGFTVLQAV